jgi:hypothetical protein
MIIYYLQDKSKCEQISPQNHERSQKTYVWRTSDLRL